MNAFKDVAAGFRDAWSWQGVGAVLALILMLAVLGYFGISAQRVEARMRAAYAPPFQVPGL